MDPKTLVSVYLWASEGGTPPTTAIYPGDVLNTLVDTTQFDPAKVYLVTPDGVNELID